MKLFVIAMGLKIGLNVVPSVEISVDGNAHSATGIKVQFFWDGFHLNWAGMVLGHLNCYVTGGI